MRYEGRAQLGDGDGATVTIVSIPDVESSEWFAHVEPCEGLSTCEVPVTLLDEGIYNAWRGSALVRISRGPGRITLLGISPLTPPVGA